MSDKNEIVISDKYRSEVFNFAAFVDENRDKLSSCYHRNNLWNNSHSILVREFQSCKMGNKYYFYLDIKCLRKTQRITKVQVVLFADHGPKQIKAIRATQRPDPELIKEKDYFRYTWDYRDGIYYVLELGIVESQESTISSWVETPVKESVQLEFCTVYYHSSDFEDKTFFENAGLFEEIEQDKVDELINIEIQKSRVKRADQSGTLICSLYERQ